MKTISGSIKGSSYKIGEFTPNLLIVNARPMCPNAANRGYKDCPACSDSKGEALTKTINSAVKWLIKQGVNVLVYTLAGESSDVVKLIAKNIAVEVAKKRKRGLKRAS